MSRDNVERYLKGKRYVLGSVPEMRDFEAYANAEYIWNSHFSHFGGERIVPTVSARQLEKMGFAGGANSRNPYNRQFLRSDDQVYFQVALVNRTPRIDLPHIESTNSEYGDESFKLAEDYLQHAWISPDTMRANDFGLMAEVLAPDLWKQVTERMPENEIRFLSFKKLDNVLPPEFITIREMSHRLDFTVEDFKTVFSQLFLQEMDALRQSNPAEFRKALETIRAPHTQEAEVKKSNLYYKTSENFPELHLSFDMKVPAFVPADKLIPQ
ncbi:MAG: hypothetical protein JST16_08260 [Bdellovibrionales bacterium]|nr:hypothetical protein [Bdellovibrionales bacterium]